MKAILRDVLVRFHIPKQFLVVQNKSNIQVNLLERTLEEIRKELYDRQLFFGERIQQNKFKYERQSETYYTYTGNFKIEIQTMNYIVKKIAITFIKPMLVDCSPTFFVFERHVFGQWIKERGSITALYFTTNDSLFKQHIDHLSLDEKVGQMLMIGFRGKKLPYTLKRAFKEHIGNVVLYKKNIKSIVKLRELISAINTEQTSFPIWVAIDEEGGRVSRLPSELIKIPSAQVLATKYSLDEVEAIANHLGEAFIRNGLSLNFAPVMDINSQINNSTMGDRAFGTTADEVSRYAGRFAKGLQQAGVFTIAKHFPGHGDTTADSHFSLPIIEKSFNQLQQEDLQPFQQAVAQNIDGIMVGHLLVQSLDKKNPASLSSTIVTDLLRRQWKYDGIIITDELSMDALRRPLPEAILAAIQAGNDIALVKGSLSKILKGKKLIIQAVEEGIIPMEQINESVYRILLRKQGSTLKDFSINHWNETMKMLLK